MKDKKESEFELPYEYVDTMGFLLWVCESAVGKAFTLRFTSSYTLSPL